MARTFVEVIIGDSFPVTVHFFSDGKLQLFKLFSSPPIVELKFDGVSSIFTDEGFSLLEQGRKWGDFQDYRYNVEYNPKQMPVLTAWLKQQELIFPFGE